MKGNTHISAKNLAEALKKRITLMIILLICFVSPSLVMDGYGKTLEQPNNIREFLIFKTKEQISSSLLLDSEKRRVAQIPFVNLYFSFRGSMLIKDSETQLAEFLTAIIDEEFRSYRFEIVGHTCSIGDGSFNQKLSEQRAKSVKDWLVAHGFEEARLTAAGYGGKKPIVDDRAKEGRMINGRIEIRVAGLIIACAPAPIVKRKNEEEDVYMVVPRSQKYSTALLEEGIKLYSAGKYREAISAFEKSLEDFRLQCFEEGEIAALGNLYLANLAAGDEKKALEYLEAYRKKRRRK